jgi:phosphatidylinositol dimannoside acyltransferase
METVQPPELYDLMATERSKPGVRFLPITEGATLRELIAALRRNETVLLALDRDVLHSGVVMPFFGKPARIPTGAIALARLTGAPIVLGALWRVGTAQLVGHVTTFPLDLVGPTTRGDDATCRALAPLVAAMERTIKQHPDQWMAVFTDDVWLTSTETAKLATASEHPAGNSRISAS